MNAGTIMFDQIEARPADPILGLSAALKKDTNQNKIDLGVGVYKERVGTYPVMKAVETAERRKCDVEDSKAYIAQAGPEGFIRHTLNLILGKCPSGDQGWLLQYSALPLAVPDHCVAAEFINGSAPGSKIFVSNPSWPTMCRCCRLQVSPWRNIHTTIMPRIPWILMP